MGNESKICPSCQTLNHLFLADCWKCKTPFPKLAPTPKKIDSAKEIKIDAASEATVKALRIALRNYLVAFFLFFGSVVLLCSLRLTSEPFMRFLIVLLLGLGAFHILLCSHIGSVATLLKKDATLTIRALLFAPFGSMIISNNLLKEYAVQRINPRPIVPVAVQIETPHQQQSKLDLYLKSKQNEPSQKTPQAGTPRERSFWRILRRTLTILFGIAFLLASLFFLQGLCYTSPRLLKLAIANYAKYPAWTVQHVILTWLFLLILTFSSGLISYQLLFKKGKHFIWGIIFSAALISSFATLRVTPNSHLPSENGQSRNTPTNEKTKTTHNANDLDSAFKDVKLFFDTVDWSLKVQKKEGSVVTKEYFRAGESHDHFEEIVTVQKTVGTQARLLSPKLVAAMEKKANNAEILFVGDMEVLYQRMVPAKQFILVRVLFGRGVVFTLFYTTTNLENLEAKKKQWFDLFKKAYIVNESDVRQAPR